MAQPVKAPTPDLRVVSSCPALGSIMGTEPIKEKKVDSHATSQNRQIKDFYKDFVSNENMTGYFHLFPTAERLSAAVNHLIN